MAETQQTTTPSIKNILNFITSKIASNNGNNNGYYDNNNIKNNNSTNSRTGSKSIVVNTDNYLFIIAIAITIVVLAVIYLLSKPFRVNKTMTSIGIYGGYQQITSYDFAHGGDKRLADMRIASSYNSAHIGYQMYDYTSEEMINGVLKCGARYLEFNIFNSEFGAKAIPTVSMGYKVGEWKMCLTDVPFEMCANAIAKHAFSVLDSTGLGVPNPDDPLFIGLALNTNSNLNCLNTLADILMDYFGDRFINPRYSYQNMNDIGDITMNELMGRVVIFCSDGYQGSKLEEIVNYCWDNVDNSPNYKLQRINANIFNTASYTKDKLIEFNKNGLTIVVPHGEGDIITRNYDAMNALNYGCQFVALNFQLLDSNMDNYITVFKNKGIVEKPENIQKQQTTIHNNNT